MVKCRVII